MFSLQTQFQLFNLIVLIQLRGNANIKLEAKSILLRGLHHGQQLDNILYYKCSRVESIKLSSQSVPNSLQLYIAF